jgi:RNA polymerase sigma-70 factor (ECF subfamily)
MIETKSLQQLALDFVDSRNERAFTLLHNRLKPGLKKFVQKYHQDSDTVDEILAITLSKAFVYVDSYDSRWNFSTWIYKICQNECLMEIRRKNSISSLDYMMDNKMALRAINSEDWKTEEDHEYFSNEETVYADSIYSEVLDEIRNLPEHYKEVIQDRILEKMKYKDIAEKRNLKINTVRSRIHSAKKVIKSMWMEKKKQSSTKPINIIGVTVLEMMDDRPKKVTRVSSNNNIVILNVTYGSEDTCINVTEKAKLVYQQKGLIKSSNRLGGDPCHGMPKFMKVTYTLNDIEHTVEIKEGKNFEVR